MSNSETHLSIIEGTAADREQERAKQRHGKTIRQSVAGFILLTTILSLMSSIYVYVCWHQTHDAMNYVKSSGVCAAVALVAAVCYALIVWDD